MESAASGFQTLAATARPGVGSTSNSPDRPSAWTAKASTSSATRSPWIAVASGRRFRSVSESQSAYRADVRIPADSGASFGSDSASGGMSTSLTSRR